MRIPIAKEGYPFIVPLGLLTLLLLLFGLEWLAAVVGLLFLFVVYFFRDPEREVPGEAKAVVSPADGKVVEITTEEDPFMGKSFTRISIFLNVFNVHVNRVPVGGVIAETRYNPGKFMNAFNDKASLDNEQNILLLRDGESEVLVKQIAGLIARRIVCWVKPGDRVEKGQRFGLIRFGSRVDVFLPPESTLKIALGDKLKGGSSIMGYLP